MPARGWTLDDGRIVSDRPNKDGSGIITVTTITREQEPCTWIGPADENGLCREVPSTMTRYDSKRETIAYQSASDREAKLTAHGLGNPPSK